MEEKVREINTLLERAYHLFDVYRERFARPPTISHIREMRDLPVLNVFEVLKQVDYAKSHVLRDVQKNTPRTFFNLYDNVFPGLITDQEYGRMKKALFSILDSVNITRDDNLLIVSDEDRSYLTLDFTNMLLEEQCHVFIVFVTRLNNIASIRDMIRDIGINVVFDFTQTGIIRGLDAACLKRAVFINRRVSILKPRIQSYSLYHVGKIGFVGISDLSQGDFYYPEGDFFIETDEHDNILVTCLFRRLFPLIRYLTFDKGHFAGDRLCISSYMGVIDEHPATS